MIFRTFFLLFTASVRSRPPGPPAVPGVFGMIFITIYTIIQIWCCSCLMVNSMLYSLFKLRAFSEVIVSVLLLLLWDIHDTLEGIYKKILHWNTSQKVWLSSLSRHGWTRWNYQRIRRTSLSLLERDFSMFIYQEVEIEEEMELCWLKGLYCWLYSHILYGNDVSNNEI